MFIIDDGVVGSVDKKYVLAGDLLAVQCWTCDEPGTHYNVFTRVQDPIPGGMVGSWQFDWVWDRDNEDESDDLIFTLTAEVAESITLVREARHRSGELHHIRTIEATWEFDPVEWFVNLTIIQVTNVEGEEEPEVDDNPARCTGDKAENRVGTVSDARPRPCVGPVGMRSDGTTSRANWSLILTIRSVITGWSGSGSKRP